jgi:5,10-methylenetetrahydromethanopterin reductase
VVLFSLAFEGDRKIDEYIRLASYAEELGFYSFQIYEHLPFKPALPISFIIANYTKRIKIGPVTIPVFLYNPLQLARYISFLNEISNGRAIVGISRGAYYEYLGKEVKRSIFDVINFLKEFEINLKKMSWSGNIEIYVGTSGPILAKKASSVEIVSSIVVDMLWNPYYARKMKEILMSSGKNRYVKLIARPFTFISKDFEKKKSKFIDILKTYIRELVGDSPMLEAANIKFEELNETRIIEEKVIPNFTAAGSIEDILEQTAKMVEAGVDHICYGHPLSSQPFEVMKLIKDKIMTYFSSY